MHVAALTTQKGLRDLGSLPGLAESVAWLESGEAATEPAPLVVCGLWLAQSADEARAVLRGRTQAGLTTVVVPRLQAGDLSGLLGAPATIEVVPGEFRGVSWDGQDYAVPGVAVLETSLHAGKWAVAAGLGTAVLAWRPHAGAGAVVLCTAALTGRPLGVEREQQRQLLERILREAASGTTAPRREELSVAERVPLGTFLDEEGEAGAALLLAWLVAGADEAEAVRSAAQQLLGLELQTPEIKRMLARLVVPGVEEARAELQRRGWGPHLRRLPRTGGRGDAP
jgi:hypothetical protein